MSLKRETEDFEAEEPKRARIVRTITACGPCRSRKCRCDGVGPGKICAFADRFSLTRKGRGCIDRGIASECTWADANDRASRSRRSGGHPGTRSTATALDASGNIGINYRPDRILPPPRQVVAKPDGTDFSLPEPLAAPRTRPATAHDAADAASLADLTVDSLEPSLPPKQRKPVQNGVKPHAESSKSAMEALAQAVMAQANGLEPTSEVNGVKANGLDENGVDANGSEASLVASGVEPNGASVEVPQPGS